MEELDTYKAVCSNWQRYTCSIVLTLRLVTVLCSLKFNQFHYNYGYERHHVRKH